MAEVERRVGSPALATYESLLSSDPELAMSEGSRFFEGNGAVQESLRRIASRLEELGIPYAVAGGMALFRHGYRRYTEDVDILVTRDGLRAIHEALEGRGYVRPFERSKNFRDAATKVKIEFLIAGDYPGDGRPKPVAFPEPAEVAVTLEGVRYLDLPTLVELKLASGMTGGPDREKDLVDIRTLIKALDLPEAFADRLNEYVRPKFHELHEGLRASPRRFLRFWSEEGPTEAGFSLEDALAAGLAFEPTSGESSGDGYLVTTDRDLARRFGLEDASEFMPDEN